MDTKNLSVSVSRNKKLDRIILTFFTKSGGLFQCKTCLKEIRGYNFLLKQHLKVHHGDQWGSYLDLIGSEMKRNSSCHSSGRVGFLKCQVNCQSADGVEMSLSMPQSRLTRQNCSEDDLHILEVFDGFKGRMQNEFNAEPYGPYMGPYDQSEKLPLNLQLPKSELCFQTYTEFRHESGSKCQNYSINESYSDIDDLEKIEALEISEFVETQGKKKNIVIYTCKLKKCRIPCICKDCFLSDSQCKIHKIKHEDLFDYEKDSMTIRSSESVFKDSSFLSNSYTIRYPNIPIDCSHCTKDLLHHNLYHLKYHESCKFCLQSMYKLRPTTLKSFHKKVKNHKQFLNSICPHCDQEFVEKHQRNKHEEYAHGFKRLVCSLCDEIFATQQALAHHEDMVHKGIRYRKEFWDILCPHCDQKFLEKLKRDRHVKYVHGKNRLDCNLCEENFASKQALMYHEDVVHKKLSPVKCEVCGASFASSISLKNHRKYVHSDSAKCKCGLCGALFKQNKDLMFHIRNKHQINTKDHFKNEWNDTEERERFQCTSCDSNYKYKKDLEAHKKKNHGSQSEATSFSCKICGKAFTQNNNCLRHERNHK